MSAILSNAGQMGAQANFKFTFGPLSHAHGCDCITGAGRFILSNYINPDGVPYGDAFGDQLWLWSKSVAL